MRFSLRLGLALLPPFAISLLVVLAATQVILDRLLVDQIESRVGFLLGNLRAGIEANLSLGRPLEEITVAQDLIEREQAGDPAVLAIDVFSADGVSVYSTNRGVIGEPVPPAWHRAAGAERSEGTWRLETLGEIILGTPVRNDLGEIVAQIAVVLSATEKRTQSSELLWHLASLAGWLLPLGLLLVGAAGFLLGRAMTAPFAPVPSILAGTIPAAPAENTLTGAAAAARLAELDALDGLDEASRKIKAIDDAA